jgi:hypothetical protein
MNLVQINERLKDLPMQVIQQYANGMNPEVPPYLALGELQRREMSQKQMATAQGAQQGPQPSIKEQVEQKAGLMQLQQMQQQQMAQQMAQPRGPMPASEGTPQPVDQPEVAMARGGLAAVPMRSDMFEYASGGIIAFAKGETVEDPRRKRQEGESFADFRKRMFDLDLQLQRDKNAAQESGREAERQRRLAERGEEFTVPPSPFVDRPALPTRAATPAPSGTNFAPVNPADMMGSPVAGLPAALNKAAGPTPAVKPPRPTAQPPVVQPPAAQPPVASGLPAALPQGPVQTGAPPAASIPVSADRAEVEALMREQKRAAPTAQGIISDVNALMPAGMQEEAMKRLLGEQRARADARQAAYESSKPTGLQDFIRVMGQAGQSKGFSGLAPAYTALQQQRRTEDLAMQKQQDELLTAIEGRGMAFDKDVFGARTGAMDKAQTLFGQSQKSILEAATAKLGADQGRLDKQTQLKMQQDLKMFELAQEERLKGMDLEQRERERKTTAANNPAAQAAQFVALKQRARDLREKGQVAEADKLDAQAADMMTFKVGSGTAAVGAENSQTRMLREALKDVNGRLEFMDPKDPEYKTLMEQSKKLSQRVVERALKEAGEGGNVSSGPVDKTNPLLK